MAIKDYVRSTAIIGTAIAGIWLATHAWNKHYNKETTPKTEQTSQLYTLSGSKQIASNNHKHNSDNKNHGNAPQNTYQITINVLTSNDKDKATIDSLKKVNTAQKDSISDLEGALIETQKSQESQNNLTDEVYIEAGINTGCYGNGYDRTHEVMPKNGYRVPSRVYNGGYPTRATGTYTNTRPIRNVNSGNRRW